MDKTSSLGGRPTISDKPLTGVFPPARCSDEQQARIEYIAGRLGIKVSELLRTYVDFCTLNKPHSSAKSLVKASRKLAQEMGDE